nr:2-dehydro-3-deoxygalactonokinase [Thalassococcus sp. S3]
MDWIAVDWGTSRLRAWAMSDGKVHAQAESDDGMRGLTRDRFEPTLLSLVEPWLTAQSTPVVACGMVGARQGWVEAPYQTVPIKPLSATPVPVPQGDPRLAAYVIAGLKQTTPPDVMRGEETQIAGFLALNPNWDGVICLPGTHTKWAQVSAGEVVSFQTCMTGELFALLSTQSVLSHSIAQKGWDAGKFEDGLADALSRPERLATRLFSVRSRDLLEAAPKEGARAYLSGLLIGAELAATRAYWLGQNLAVIGSREVTEHYAQALSLQGAPAVIADADRMTLAGLIEAYRSLKETV